MPCDDAADAPKPERVPFRYQPKTDVQMRRLVVDVVCGRVFGTWQLPKGEHERMVEIFRPLLAAAPETTQEMAEQQIVGFYEYMSQRGESGRDGWPTFMSMQPIDRADAEWLLRTVTAVQEVMQRTLDAEIPPPPAPPEPPPGPISAGI